MDDSGIADYLALGHELRSVEFKGPGSRKDKPLLAKVVRAMLGMTNSRDGGKIVLGVDQKADGTPVPLGLTDKQLATWNFDDLSDSVSEYADPGIEFDVSFHEHDGMKFVLIDVFEFDDIPVLCGKNYGSDLRDGACYIRPRRKPETMEVPSQADMRDLLELATEKRLRRYLGQARRLGLILDGERPSSSNEFSSQIDDFLGQSDE